MSFELFNTLTAYGDQIGFHTYFNENVILDKLQEFSNDWAEYNPRTTTVNNRWGLSITNHNGELGAGPDLDSLPQYNDEHNTDYDEHDFIIKTPVYEIFREGFAPFEQWLFRCHLLRFGPGGYFPPHVDNYGKTINSFRLVIPLKNCNPPNFYFILDNKLLYWEHGRLYFLNTCKQHLLFNPLPSTTILVVLNVKLTEESVDHFLTPNYIR
jgi:hypothetical protein